MLKQDLLEIFHAALAAVDPYRAVRHAVALQGDRLVVAGASYDLAGFDRIVVVGAGKATARMALAVEQLLGARIEAGLIVVKAGHTAPLNRIEQIEAAHPLPDRRGVEGARRVLDLAAAADERTLVIGLLSGGASALLTAPAGDLTLADKQNVTDLLLRAGASIRELNTVRKHLSSVKGGRLAAAAFPARMLTLILSDVIGDRPEDIASGPSAADGSTYADAVAVIDRYGLRDRLPERTMAYLQRGRAGAKPETLKAGDERLTKVRNVVIGGLRQALAAASDTAVQRGFVTDILTAELQGEARDAARRLAHAARGARDAGRRCCLLSGGETTVTVRGAGQGGRNQELALAFALETAGLVDIALLSAGTDGSDGSTDAAGAMVDGTTAALARRLGLEPLQYLENNDSYGFFTQLDASSGAGCQVITGPTGTNVMDIQILLVGA